MKNILSSTTFSRLGFIVFVIGLLLYSYTQVDLSLTLSQASVYQVIEKQFQYVGYFNRQLSACLFVVLLSGLFSFFVILLRQIKSNHLSGNQLVQLILVVTGILFFSYNAFSYDLFNYIFDAKIITQYHENPYLKKALDFPQDPMLSFMRWTHRTYPYGPLWLAFTIPLSYAGLQIFSITYFLFKFFMLLSYLGSTYCIYKIAKKIMPEQALLASVGFALNPLVLIESLVSAHNDIVMLFFSLLAVYLLIKKRILVAFMLLGISIAIKFATLFLLPVFIIASYLLLTKKHVKWEAYFSWMLLSMVGAVAVASFRTTYQPWYLLYLLPFASLVWYKKSMQLPLTVLSLTSLVNYLPYLAVGNWDPPIPQQLLQLNLASLFLSLVAFVYLYRRELSLQKAMKS